jgi:hypothetical protein
MGLSTAATGPHHRPRTAAPCPGSSGMEEAAQGHPFWGSDGVHVSEGVEPVEKNGVAVASAGQAADGGRQRCDGSFEENGPYSRAEEGETGRGLGTRSNSHNTLNVRAQRERGEGWRCHARRDG